ncbi:MAG: peptidylprolyl isomerase [Prevotellaceae bacterium]|nr:peptidylprolyl isomerase [Prevotellaceae bacterium]
MKKIYKVSAVGLAALTLVMAGHAMTMKRTAKKAPTDSVKVEKEAEVPEACVIDEVIWVVGDEPILKSDVETMRLQSQMEGLRWENDPDCAIPEQMAVQKLFLHQAAIDSIEVSESEVTASVDEQINYWISMAGSKEKLEEYRNQTVAQMRQQMRDDFKNQKMIAKMKQELVKDINVTPSDVRKYFSKIPEDSLPIVPMEVEVEIITRQPKATQEEINRIKEELRDYTDRVTRGETSFATLARLYSEDPGSARQGGEMDYIGRGMLDPAFANVAFNLTDPKKISKIVETEFGFHIIQLIDKRGDRIKVRHILRRPRIEQEAIDFTKLRLDSVVMEINEGKYSFEEAASYISDDKDTRNNRGLMSFMNEETQSRSSRVKMKDLPTEVAQQVENLKVGEISKPFSMINSKGKQVVALVKLKSRRDSHRASITEDFQVLKNIVLAKEREKKIHEWVAQKIKNTYVWMTDKYKSCNYEYQGWVK